MAYLGPKQNRTALCSDTKIWILPIAKGKITFLNKSPMLVSFMDCHHFGVIGWHTSKDTFVYIHYTFVSSKLKWIERKVSFDQQNRLELQICDGWWLMFFHMEYPWLSIYLLSLFGTCFNFLIKTAKSNEKILHFHWSFVFLWYKCDRDISTNNCNIQPKHVWTILLSAIDKLIDLSRWLLL